MKLRNNTFMYQEPDTGNIKRKSSANGKKASVSYTADHSRMDSENSQVSAPKLFTMPNRLVDTLSTFKPVNEMFPSGSR
jgi:hypothetical protein